MALQYVDENRRIRFLTLTGKRWLTLALVNGIAAAASEFLAISWTPRSPATVVNNRYRLLGLRVQFKLGVGPMAPIPITSRRA